MGANITHSNISFRQLLDSPGIVAFAHRGAGDHAPENTFAAFEAAVALGYACIETDIQASSDGTLYAFHDKDLRRLTGNDQCIGDLKDHDIASLKVDGKHPIPKLSELFEAFPDTLFNLDPKTWPAAKPMAELILKMGKVNQVCIGSFSGGRIKAVLDILGPQTAHSIGMAEAARFYCAALAGIKMRTNAHCLQFPMLYRGVPLITRRTVDYAHRIGLKVHVWTVNEPGLIHHLFDLGVDGIMTDNCGMLKRAMTDNGHWNG